MNGPDWLQKLLKQPIVSLRSPLSLDECRERLEATVERRPLFSFVGYAGSSLMLVKLYAPNRFRLQTRIYYGNSFKPFFYGRLLPNDRGTTIEGEFRLHPWPRCFMVVWYSFLALFFIGSVCAIAAGNVKAPESFLFIVVLLGLAIYGWALMKFGWWLARGNQPIILDFLSETLACDGPREYGAQDVF